MKIEILVSFLFGGVELLALATSWGLLPVAAAGEDFAKSAGESDVAAAIIVEKYYFLFNFSSHVQPV